MTRTIKDLMQGDNRLRCIHPSIYVCQELPQVAFERRRVFEAVVSDARFFGSHELWNDLGASGSSRYRPFIMPKVAGNTALSLRRALIVGDKLTKKIERQP